MNGQQISLKSIDELRVDASGQSFQFFIPAYQRGFRWSPLQVTQLLDDMWEFTQRRNPQPDDFYCLQPLVIKARPSGDFEVVDGQQRLTTLLLILRYFNGLMVENHRQTLFALEYETRPNLDLFLEAPSNEAASANVDFFHLYQAIQAIKDWFSKRESEVWDIKSALLNRTKVIWFELADSDNPVDAFTRLNVGKIPLTNEELIRALFLSRTGSDDKETKMLQLRIANEWDLQEKSLQNDAFWYFLNDRPGKKQNRIGFLFDLVARAEGLAPGTESDAYEIFYTFNQHLKAPEATPHTEWQKIKQTYLMLEEWFEDRVLYHMVGFLVSEGMPIKKIRILSDDCTKSAFEQRLRSEIFRQTIGNEWTDPPDEKAVREHIASRLTELSYGPNRQKIKSILLLFNLATLIHSRRSNLRFQFDSFKRENWDIEHIRSVTDDQPERHHERKSWLDNCLGYLRSIDAEKELRQEIEGFLNLSQTEATNEVFDPLYEKVLNYFDEAIGAEAEHGLSNLTLLDEHTNRSYKNAVFAVKRKRLLDLDQAGIFVPLCTRNVFLKCYSSQVDNLMFWSEKDRSGYEEAIINDLTNFFCGRMDGI